MTFFELSDMYRWKPIAHCPGRYLLVRSENNRFNNMFQKLRGIKKYRVEQAKDLVLVYAFEDGGFISFLHDDGYIVHTLNTQEGFIRKLNQLNIEIH